MELAPALDVAAPAARAAVPAMVVGVGLDAGGRERLGDGGVAAAVLAQPVDDRARSPTGRRSAGQCERAQVRPVGDLDVADRGDGTRRVDGLHDRAIVAGREARAPYDARMTAGWVEVGERVFVRRYAFFDQNIVAVLGRDEALVLDTRTTHAQAREILDDLRELGSPRRRDRRQHPRPLRPRVRQPGVPPRPDLGPRAVRGDAPAFGRADARCGRRRGARHPRTDLAEVVIDPPDRTFREQATICLDDGREVSLRYLGRGHTDNDVVLRVDGADVLCAGDLVENGATPYFGDGYPMDWPATAEALLALVGPSTVVVPGHGDHAGRAFVESQLAGFRAVADAARRVARGRGDGRRRPAAGPLPGRRGARAGRAGGRAAPRRARRRRPGQPVGLGRVRATRTTQRPRAWPSTIASSAGSRVSRSTSVIPSSMPRGSRSSDRRAQSARRGPIARFALSMPEQRDAAQDEREHRRVELGARRVARSTRPPPRAGASAARRAASPPRPCRPRPPSAPTRAAGRARMTSSRVRNPVAPRSRRRSISSGLPVAAQTSWPRAARIAMAVEPTPPAAPVTSTGPSPALSP